MVWMAARGGVLVHGRGDSVGREDERGAGRDLFLAVDEDGAPFLELVDDVGVVDDLLAHVNRGPVEVERLLDRVHGALHSGAISARRGK